jgi:hypothetical protein
MLYIKFVLTVLEGDERGEAHEHLQAIQVLVNYGDAVLIEKPVFA